MIKLFKVPVVVTKEDFPDITYKAEGVADYWDIHSAEHENLEDALNFSPISFNSSENSVSLSRNSVIPYLLLLITTVC